MSKVALKVASENSGKNRFRKSFLFNSYVDFSKTTGHDDQKWWLIDAKDVVLGRMAVKIACLLRGKHKPCYAPFFPCGDRVVVVNMKHIHMTGKKIDEKVYYRHTGYAGGLKTDNPRNMLNSGRPEKLLILAVRRMLPRGTLGLKLLKNLYIYADSDHKHAAQNPELIDFGSQHPVNVKRSGNK